MTFEEVLREFAEHPQGATDDVGVFVCEHLPHYIDEGFDIDSPVALNAEQRRLLLAAEKRRALDRLAPLPAQVRLMMKRTARRHALRKPCEVCGGKTPENRLGVVPKYCSDTCCTQARENRRAAEKKCRLAHCPNGRDGKSAYCRAHLDAIAAKERERRRLRKAA